MGAGRRRSGSGKEAQLCRREGGGCGSARCGAAARPAAGYCSHARCCGAAGFLGVGQRWHTVVRTGRVMKEITSAGGGVGRGRASRGGVIQQAGAFKGSKRSAGRALASAPATCAGTGCREVLHARPPGLRCTRASHSSGLITPSRVRSISLNVCRRGRAGPAAGGRRTRWVEVHALLATAACAAAKPSRSPVPTAVRCRAPPRVGQPGARWSMGAHIQQPRHVVALAASATSSSPLPPLANGAMPRTEQPQARPTCLVHDAVQCRLVQVHVWVVGHQRHQEALELRPLDAPRAVDVVDAERDWG